VVDKSQPPPPPPPPPPQLGRGARPAGPASAASQFDRLRDREEGGEDKGGEEEKKAAVKDQIAQEMQNWCENVKKRRLQLLKKVPVAKLDS
jgi:hypothetical protein